jgi:hypothetical protein
MSKYIAYFLSAWLILGLIFLPSGKGYSQANQSRDSVTKTPKKTDTYVKGLTPGRARALVGDAVGIISLIIGWRAKARSKRGNSKVRTWATLAVVFGIIGLILSVVHLGMTAGAVFGSGSGKAGAIVALVPNSIGIILGGMVLRKKNEMKV